MPITTDFLALYQELQVAPECSIAHFKSSYRRRVAELHPDRMPSDTRQASMERLQSLLLLHDAAMKFYDRHGRLPGASRTISIPFSHTRRLPQTTSPRSRSRIWIYAAAAAVVAIVCILLPSAEFETPDRQTSATAIPAPPLGSEAHHAQTLRRGMDEREVRSIQGEPTIVAADRWEYGPSTVQFDHHKLIDWYSSPLRPLKISVQPMPVAKDFD